MKFRFFTLQAHIFFPASKHLLGIVVEAVDRNVNEKTF